MSFIIIVEQHHHCKLQAAVAGLEVMFCHQKNNAKSAPNGHVHKRMAHIAAKD
jgi:hypothetical protein